MAITYTVKRGTTSGGPYTTMVQTGLTSPTWTDNTVVDGHRYFYVVTAVNSNGASGNSNEAAALPIGRPSNLAGIYTAPAINLTWTAAGGDVDHYNVYRANAPEGPWVLLDTAAAASYSDHPVLPAHRYLYYVTAVYHPDSFVESLATNIVTIYTVGGTFMADRLTVNQRIFVGKETTKGTAVAAAIRLMAVSLMPSPKTAFLEHRADGNKRPDLEVMTKEWSEAPVTGIATYTELGLYLASCVSAPVSLANATTGVYNHWFRSAGQAEDTLQSYTVEYGSEVRAHKHAYGMFSGLAFKMNRDSVDLTGSMYGGKIQDGITLSTGANEVQTLTITATAGTYPLSFQGAPTTQLAFGAVATAIQTALRALPTIGSGNVNVTGTGPFVITFVGALAGTNQPIIGVDSSLLTGGTATIQETNRGGMMQYDKIPILPGDVDVYLASAPSGLGVGGNKLLRSFDSSWSIADRHSPFWTQNSAKESFTAHAETSAVKETFDLLVEADATGMGLLVNTRQGDTLYIRIDATSKAYQIAATGLYHRFVLDAAVKISDIKPFADEQGIYATGYTLQIIEDAVWGKSYEIMLQNGIASY